MIMEPVLKFGCINTRPATLPIQIIIGRNPFFRSLIASPFAAISVERWKRRANLANSEG
jgi:hypothetical protein